MNEIVRLGLSLMIIGLVASIALSITNQLTQERIKQQQAARFQESLRKVVPEAESFEQRQGYFEAYSNGKPVAKVLQLDAQGYSSVIKLLVGVDGANTILGIDVLSQTETPGLGANVEKEGFLSQFTGRKLSEVKLVQDEGQIDAITGATITSRAVIESISSSMLSKTGASPSPETETEQKYDAQAEITIGSEDNITVQYV